MNDIAEIHFTSFILDKIGCIGYITTEANTSSFMLSEVGCVLYLEDSVSTESYILDFVEGTVFIA